MPSAAIGADVMAGFPGETDAEFEATRRLIEQLPFTYLHVFTYSARPGTPAAVLPDQVPVHVGRERNKILRDLAAEKKLAFMRSLVGKQMDAITLGSCVPVPAGSAPDSDSPDAKVFTEALTDNYQKLFLKGRHVPNRWITARVEAVEGGALTGAVA
jgi:threonylcarbamoyladenosine tRNA methylthiotransferase MtaB